MTSAQTITHYVDHPDLRDTKLSRSLCRESERILREGVSTPDDEMVLFKAMHACARCVSQSADPTRRRTYDAMALYNRLRDFLADRHTGLVYEMWRHSRVANVDRDDMISEGFWALLQAIQRFDPWRGFRFSTYACQSILHAFTAVGRRMAREANSRHRLSARAGLALTMPETASRAAESDLIDRLQSVLARNSAHLTPAERFVLRQRIMRNEGEPKQTLATLGGLFRLSKEGVRQIELSALRKLREALTHDHTPTTSAA